MTRGMAHPGSNRFEIRSWRVSWKRKCVSPAFFRAWLKAFLIAFEFIGHTWASARECLQHLDRMGRQPDRVVDDLPIGAQTGTGIGLQQGTWGLTRACAVAGWRNSLHPHRGGNPIGNILLEAMRSQFLTSPDNG